MVSVSSNPYATLLLEPAPAIRIVPRTRDLQVPQAEPTQETLNMSVTHVSLLRQSPILKIGSCAENQIRSPLLRLPGEIRNQIFEDVFSTDEVIELRPYEGSDYADQHSNKTATVKIMLGHNLSPFNVLFVSRQIYLETRLLPYSLNTFHCAGFWFLNIILRRMPSEQRCAIRTLKLRWATGQHTVAEMLHKGHHTARTTLRMLTGLETVVVSAQGKKTADMLIVKVALKNFADPKGVNVVFET